MTGYTLEKARDFWFDFDNQTLMKRTPEIRDLIRAAYQVGQTVDLDAPVDLFRLSYRRSDHPRMFVDEVSRRGDAFVRLSDAVLRIMHAHFPDDEDLTHAFVDFGQGILFDDRRPRDPGNAVHTMDGSPDNWAGYHRWHAAVRAAMLTGGDQATLLGVLRNIAVAWAIQSETAPAHDRPDNPGLDPERLDALVRYWLSLPPEEIDRAFVLNPTRAPRVRDLDRLRARAALLMGIVETEAETSYAVVTEILERAAGTGKPRHGEKRRFWTLPLQDFLAIGSIYGVELIAPEGPDRGERSGLIQALRGTGEFTDDGFGRMPRDRPPVPDEEIAYISKWIDQGCPE